MPTKTPKNLTELFEQVNKAAEDFGFKKGENAVFRDCLTTKSDTATEIRKANDDDTNFWFGYIREDEPGGGAYNGLSYVIFPERDSETTRRCLVSIGIGSSSIGKDGDLAASPGFRRSFMRLVKDGGSGAKFFFKLRFDEMETSTPALQEELYSEEAKYDDVFIGTSTKYNADTDKEAPGLLPAAFIVDYTTDGGWNLIKAWLAQYAKWRNWDKYMNGADKSAKTKATNKAIEACRVDLVCPDTLDIKNVLMERQYIVLQGAPGCGKTWSANEVGKTYFSGANDKIIFTQFHAETSYSDFVYGIRPSLDGQKLTYKGQKGILLNAIDAAEKAKKKGGDVLLIIDEINRANLANVLGPVFYLFEGGTSRTNDLVLGTIYDEKTGEEKKIKYQQLPDNLYVIATMNTADKSLAVVDFALRRRFSWVTLRPHKLNTTDFDAEFFDKVDALFSKYATDEELNLQPGQSYFMNKAQRRENIIYGLMPLMKEYFAEGFLLSAKEEFAQLFAAEAGVFMYE